MARVVSAASLVLRIAAIAAPAVCGASAFAQSLADQGKAIAEKHCSRCHVVDPERPFGGISSTPSFRLLVTALPDWRERFETFYGRRPHPAVIRFEGVPPNSENPPTTVPVELQLSDVEAIVAFAAGLKKAADEAQ